MVLGRALEGLRRGDFPCNTFLREQLFFVAFELLTFATGHLSAQVRFRQSVCGAIVLGAEFTITDNYSASFLTIIKGTLTASAQAEYEMECGFLLNVVICEGASIFKLFASEDEALLIRRDTWKGEK